MFQIAVQDDGKYLHYAVRNKGSRRKTLLRFAAARSADDFLQLLQFADALRQGDALFALAEELLPQRLNYLLFYFYLLALSEKKVENLDPAMFRQDFQRSMRQAKRRIESELRPGEALCLQLKLTKAEASAAPAGRCFLIDSLEDYCELALYYLLPETERLCRCEVCGAYFLKNEMQKGELCAFVQADGRSCTERRCRENAAMRLKKDPLLRLYRRIYKRQYMRCERALDVMNGLVQSPGDFAPFREWSARAMARRKAYREGQIAPEDFRRMLAELDKEITYRDLKF